MLIKFRKGKKGPTTGMNYLIPWMILDTFNSEVEPTGKRVLFHFVVALAKITKVTDGRSVRKLYRPTFFRRAVAIGTLLLYTWLFSLLAQSDCSSCCWHSYLGFFSEKAFGEDGSLKQPKQLSINKVGHGMLWFECSFDVLLWECSFSEHFALHFDWNWTYNPGVLLVQHCMRSTQYLRNSLVLRNSQIWCAH